MFCLVGVNKRKRSVSICDTSDYAREDVSNSFVKRLTAVQIQGVDKDKFCVCTVGELISVCLAEAKMTASAASKLDIEGTEVRGITDLDIRDLYIPYGISDVGNLGGCGNLQRVVLPPTVSNIKDWAFEGCVSLNEVILPDEYCAIGRCAFWGCESLSSIVIPKGVRYIQNKAFANCVGLQRVEFLDNDTQIGDSVFNNCSDVVIVAKKGSTAYEYAKVNSLRFLYAV